MHFRLSSRLLFSAGFSGAVWLALTATPAARAQRCNNCAPPPPPVCASPYQGTIPYVGRTTQDGGTEPRPTPDPGTGTTPSPTSAETPDFGATRPPAGQGETVAMKMQGNQLGALAFLPIPTPSAARPGATTANGTPINPQAFALAVQKAGSAVQVPSIRGFRISENEGPAPDDRVYFSFNYFDNVGNAVNRRLGLNVNDIRVYRETFGLEKTFLDGDASIGMRLPLDTLDASSNIASLNGSNTDVGDLSLILKYALWRDRESGSLLSAGLCVTVPTGPSGFAGSQFTSLHETTLQPWVGFVWNRGDFFVHGFEAVDVPTDSHDVTFLFSDIGVGYHLSRNRGEGRLITDIVPSFEVHFTNPLNHRGSFNLLDRVGSSDLVNLTTGVTFELNGSSTLALGVVTPVTGPKPFDFEILAQFNLRFGGGRSAGTTGGFGNYVLGN